MTYQRIHFERLELHLLKTPSASTGVLAYLDLQLDGERKRRDPYLLAAAFRYDSSTSLPLTFNLDYSIFVESEFRIRLYITEVPFDSVPSVSQPFLPPLIRKHPPSLKVSTADVLVSANPPAILKQDPQVVQNPEFDIRLFYTKSSSQASSLTEALLQDFPSGHGPFRWKSFTASGILNGSRARSPSYWDYTNGLRAYADLTNETDLFIPDTTLGGPYNGSIHEYRSVRPSTSFPFEKPESVSVDTTYELDVSNRSPDPYPDRLHEFANDGEQSVYCAYVSLLMYMAWFRLPRLVTIMRSLFENGAMWTQTRLLQIDSGSSNIDLPQNHPEKVSSQADIFSFGENKYTEAEFLFYFACDYLATELARADDYYATEGRASLEVGSGALPPPGIIVSLVHEILGVENATLYHSISPTDPETDELVPADSGWPDEKMAMIRRKDLHPLNFLSAVQAELPSLPGTTLPTDMRFGFLIINSSQLKPESTFKTDEQDNFYWLQSYSNHNPSKPVKGNHTVRCFDAPRINVAEDTGNDVVVLDIFNDATRTVYNIPPGDFWKVFAGFYIFD